MYRYNTSNTQQHKKNEKELNWSTKIKVDDLHVIVLEFSPKTSGAGGDNDFGLLAYMNMFANFNGFFFF